MIFMDETCPDHACVWTIIDAPPYEREPWDRVYQAELEAFQQGADPPVHFRLVNVRELTDLKHVLQDEHRVLFERGAR